MKNKLNMEIGMRVREKRTLMGYTREQFAEALDISERFATDIELGNRGMSFSTLIRLCNLLSVTSDYILMGKTEDNHESTTRLEEISRSIDSKYTPYAEEILSAFCKAVNASEKNEEK